MFYSIVGGVFLSAALILVICKIYNMLAEEFETILKNKEDK